MIRRLKRAYCRLAHRAVMYSGGPTYQCRTCAEVYESPALNGPVKQLAPCVSVRQVAAPKRAAKVRAIAR